MGGDFFWPGWGNVDGVVVSVSGGRDSVASLLVTLGVARRVHVDVVAVHVDNGAGWPGVWGYVRAVAARFGVPAVRLTTKYTLLDHVRRRGRWPGPRTRYCTSAKREAVEAYVRRRWRAVREDRIWNVVSVTGERMEESSRRTAMRAWSVDKRLTGAGTLRVVWRWRPVLHWPLARVRGVLQMAGVDEFEAYRYVSRTSCLFCPFARPAEWRAQARRFPLLAKVWLEVEEDVGHWLTEQTSLLMAVRDVLPPGVLYERWRPGRKRGPVFTSVVR